MQAKQGVLDWPSEYIQAEPTDFGPKPILLFTICSIFNIIPILVC